MKSDHSFEDILISWIKRINPTKVLEWGPGKSTEIIHHHSPESSITSIENQEKFHKNYVKKYPYARIIYAPIPAYGPSSYSCWPLLQQKPELYDLIFVDGRQRVSCLITSINILTKSGVIILHDCDRIHYRHVLKFFDILEHRNNTMVLRPKSIFLQLN